MAVMENHQQAKKKFGSNRKQEFPSSNMSGRIPFCGHLAASGHGEVWDHTDEKKFKQFGWRCTTNETEYSHNTLIGNWNEQRYDTRKMADSKPIQSQFSHYFQTSYSTDFKNAAKTKELPDHVRKMGGMPTEPRSFPRHQPELDPPSFKESYNSFKTTSSSSYKNPKEM